MRTVRIRHLVRVAGWILVWSAPDELEAGTIRVPADHARIDQALALAGPGDVVEVAPGVHSPAGTGEVFPLLVPSQVTLAGAGMGLSVLDAQGQGSVVHLTGDSARVTGFTLTGGCSVEGGGALVFPGVTAVIDHNLVRQNLAATVGSGIFIGQSATTWIHHNVLWENGDRDVQAVGDPHGIQFTSAGGLVEHNVVGRGDSNGILTNTSAVTIRNNIIIQNGIPGVRGRGICAVSGARPIIAHNIFFENQIAAILVAPSAGDVSGTEANDLDPDDGVYGNLDLDPWFLDADGGDWRVAPGSPAIDAGDPASPLDPDGTWADIGVFYFPHEPTGFPGDEGPPVRFHAAPNPFRDVTVFHYRITREEQVEIAVYDALGRRVRHLIDRREGPGTYLVEWDGRSDSGIRVARGVYVAHLRVGAADARRKILRVP